MRNNRAILSLLCATLTALCLRAQSNSVPLVNNPLMPVGAAPGSGALTLTVNGTGFVQGSVVTWNQSPRATTFLSASRLTAAITAADLASAGTASVTVVNPAPGGGRSNAVFFAVAAARPSVALTTKATYNAGYIPDDLAVGDFNSDGKLDLALVEWNGSALTAEVLLGHGDGTFQPSSGPFDDYCCGGPLAIGDFNGDGKLDIATRNSILLGKGDGTLQAPLIFAPDGNAQSIVAGDFNADGKLDLAIAYGGSSNFLDIFLGNGDGTFQNSISYSLNRFPYRLAVGDFNSDGHLDLAVASDGGIALLVGNGDGTFQAPTIIAGTLLLGLAAADFNGDGILDLVATAKNAFYVSLGRGDGTFGPPVSYEARNSNSQLAVGDFNGDMVLDLAFADYVSKDAAGSQIFPGKGDGTFGPPIHTSAPLIGAFVTADFNGDGLLDLASTSGDSLAVTSILQTTVAPSPAALLFPKTPVGQTAGPQTLTITNIGPSPLNITQAAIGGGDAGDFSMVSNGCQGAAIPPLGDCTMSVTFTPSSGENRNAVVNLTDDALASPQAVVLEGQGTGFYFQPRELDFGKVTVGSRRQMVATLINTTPHELIVRYNLNGGARLDFTQHNTCGRAIKPRERCSVIVNFQPSKVGLREAELAVPAEGYAPVDLKLVGHGM